MELSYQCPGCGAVNHVDLPGSMDQTICARCHCGHRLRPEAIGEGQLLACPWCGTSDLYIQKDFPQSLGLFIVIVGFAISTVFWYLEKPILTYLVLLASALLDLVLYYKVPDVTICYRCLSQIRGRGSNPGGAFHSFDLAIGERYRQERLRAQELRRRAKPDGSPSAAVGPDIP